MIKNFSNFNRIFESEFQLYTICKESDGIFSYVADRKISLTITDLLLEDKPSPEEMIDQGAVFTKARAEEILTTKLKKDGYEMLPFGKAILL
jgi:hypothetical protein